MKAKPVKLVYGDGYHECPIEEATHLTLNIPGPTGVLTLPVITKGSRRDANAWTWNGSIEAPTLKPSVLTRNNEFRCHSWITEGKVQFLNDSEHDFAGKIVDLLDIEP